VFVRIQLRSKAKVARVILMIHQRSIVVPLNVLKRARYRCPGLRRPLSMELIVLKLARIKLHVSIVGIRDLDASIHFPLIRRPQNNAEHATIRVNDQRVVRPVRQRVGR
jgi:hypothetical protein